MSALLFAVMLGCGSEEVSVAPPPPPPEVEAPVEVGLSAAQEEKVGKAVALAKAIDADPDNADKHLSEAGMDLAALEGLMEDVARDPQMAEAYAGRR